MDEFEKIEIDKYLNWYQSISIEAGNCRILYKKQERLGKIKLYLENRLKSKFKLNEVSILAFFEGALDRKILSFSLFNAVEQKLKIIENELSLLSTEIKHCAIRFDYLIPTSLEWEYLKGRRAKALSENILNFNSLQKRIIVNEKDKAIEIFESLQREIKESFFYEYAVAGIMILLNNHERDFIFSQFMAWIEYVDFSNWLQKIIVPIAIPDNNKSLENQNKTIALYYYYLGKAGERDLYDEEIFSKVMKNRHSPQTLKRAMTAVCDINERIGIEENNKANKQRSERLKTVIKMLEKNKNGKSIKIAKDEFNVLLSKQKQSGKMKIN